MWESSVGSSTLLWVGVPGWIPATIAIVIGWSTAPAYLHAAAMVDAPGVALFLIGGVFYTFGAVVYALRPELHSAFGYHEVFSPVRGRRSRMPLPNARLLPSSAR